MTGEPELAMDIAGVGKAYRIYRKPSDRLKQMLWGRMTRQGWGADFWALHPLDLHVHRGESVAIIGRNGSGKSTLLQLISGILAPTCGSVRVHGRIAALLELGSGFNPEFTGRENILLNAAVLGLSRSQIDERMDRIIAFADIGDFIRQPVKTYSSGMFVRLAFAIAINVDPDILIVDEALAVGDTAFVGKCLMAIDEFRRCGGTLLVVSHDMGLVKNQTQRAVFLQHGRLIQVGDAVAVADNYLQSLSETPGSSPTSHFTADEAPATLAAVRFADTEAATSSTIEPGSDVGIVCDLSVTAPAQVDFNLSIYDSTKRIVAAERTPMSLIPGRHRAIRVSIQRLLLVPGTYTINVSLRLHGTQAYISWIREACTLTILGTEPVPRVYRQPMLVEAVT